MAPTAGLAAMLARLGPWSEATLAAALLAVDPEGLGGVVARARAGPVRDRFVALLPTLLAGVVVRKLPPGATEDRLIGGLDLSATLASGQPRLGRGLLTEADGGLVVVPMAERLEPGTAALLARVHDEGFVRVEREGFTAVAPARVALLLLDEGEDVEETVAPALRDRLAFHLDLDDIPVDSARGAVVGAEAVAAARARPPATLSEAMLAALVQAAEALGVPSLRGPILAARAAAAHARLADRPAIIEEDVALAVRLVLGPRATRLPAPPPAPEAPAEPPPRDAGDVAGEDESAAPLADRIVEAVVATLPERLLAVVAGRLATAKRSAGGRGASGRRVGTRGRPAPPRAGKPESDRRLHLLATLRAAAPWQRLRRPPEGERRLSVRPEDLRISRRRPRQRTVTVFAVDASGSAALHRLGEAKGAVELLLSECYVRRDEVALVVFRGTGAELVLPPTRSLTRARRALVGLAAGGGTPLAAGLEVTLALATRLIRRGETPVAVLLTDGQANIGREGTPGRERAQADALQVAQGFRLAGIGAIVIDTSPRPEARNRALADAMGARYVALPRARAGAVAGLLRPR